MYLCFSLGFSLRLNTNENDLRLEGRGGGNFTAEANYVMHTAKICIFFKNKTYGAYKLFLRLLATRVAPYLFKRLLGPSRGLPGDFYVERSTYGLALEEIPIPIPIAIS